ncbi:AAA family ATPase [Pantoea sp. Al-1710]|uniref:AAA family ATPase n=1 Tax=Candidatus Pantoea communis TaxID=2608354 RepID=A0ABX0RUN6_9GAMM|nr:AAA family ATPase [Pantoea communis]NIG21306.1 AAA family ATPase [Pantoea communis]
MKLIRLEIRKLFGLLDYSIPLDENEITMLTGPNGYGKTMILNILHSILANRLNVLCTLKFEQITLYHQEGTVFIRGNGTDCLTLIAEGASGAEPVAETLTLKEEKSQAHFWGRNNWIVEEKSAPNRTPDYARLTSDVLGALFPAGLISFIRADRLEKAADGTTVIDRCAEQLRNLMGAAEDESASFSQKLDATFPIRLFQRLQKQKQLYYTNIQQRLIGIQGKRRDYMQFGLIQTQEELLPDEGDAMEGSREYLNVLDLYINDAMEKLSPFETLHQKIALFESILREKVLAFKHIHISREQGFSFISESGDPVGRNMLSSGEQNQIVLLFCLIFNLRTHKVILIDEPEISLHVAWQQTFLDSLKKIQKINGYEKVIIATHSPAVISKNWPLTFDLYDIAHRDRAAPEAAGESE